MYVEINEKTVEIDDNIVTEILELNKKGYITTYCCGGHIEKGNAHIYVTFAKKYDFPIIPNGFKINKYGVVEYAKKDEIKEIYEKMLKNFKLWVKVLPQNTQNDID